MTSKKILQLVLAISAPLLAGCNLYAPLDAASTDGDRIEIAQKCLTDGDYDCAVAEYNKLADAALKREKLCLVYIGQAGFGLSQLIKISSSTSDKQKVLGIIANAMLPYTATKKTAADNAIEKCQDFRNNTTTGTPERKVAVLLNTLVKFTRCGVLLTRTTKEMGTDDDALTGTCTTASTSPTAVSTASVSAAGNGSVSVTQPGMCAADAVKCATDMAAISADSAELTAAGLGNVSNSFGSLPAGVTNTAGGATIVRAGLLQTL